MTEKILEPSSTSEHPISVGGLVDASLQPGGSISLTFQDGVVNVTLDQTGDWTITAGLSMFSRRFEQMKRKLADLGFFHAAEQGGVIYHLWTSALAEGSDERTSAELTLLKVLMTFHAPLEPSYIA